LGFGKGWARNKNRQKKSKANAHVQKTVTVHRVVKGGARETGTLKKKVKKNGWMLNGETRAENNNGDEEKRGENKQSRLVVEKIRGNKQGKKKVTGS